MLEQIAQTADFLRSRVIGEMPKLAIILGTGLGPIVDYIEEKQVLDEETGELKTKYRTILFDKSGQTYATGSYGIYNVLKKIVQIYGLPESWEKPLKVKVAKRPIGNGKQSLT